jgi:hypothetical protein
LASLLAVRRASSADDRLLQLLQHCDPRGPIPALIAIIPVEMVSSS